MLFIIYWEYKYYKHHFCGWKCRGKWQSKNLIGKKAIHYQNAKVRIKCYFCKQAFLRYKNYVKQYNFCSKNCYNLWMSKYQKGFKHPLFSKIKIKCDYCHKNYYEIASKAKNGKHHFCSKKCNYKWRSKFVIGKNHHNWSQTTLRCAWCKKSFQTYASRKRKKHLFYYCSFDCRIKGQSKFLVGKLASAYVHGQGKQPYTLAFNNFLKEQIRIRDEHRCQLCYRIQRRNEQKLSIHHVDYNKDHADPQRLITLCRSCNSKVDSNRDYWYAYFTYILDEMYQTSNIKKK